MPHFFTRICRPGCVIDMLEQPDSKATQAETFFSDLTSVYYLFYTLWVCFFHAGFFEERWRKIVWQIFILGCMMTCDMQCNILLSSNY